MRTETGDIWQLSTPEDTIVIPVNVGWRLTDGRNPMGKGLALQAARRWNFLAATYGEFCRKHGRATPLFVLHTANKWCRYLVLFPTKPLNVEKPYLSWRQDADLALIEVNLMHLQQHALQFCEKTDSLPHYQTSRPAHYPEQGGSRRILVPSVGCGEGHIAEEVLIQALQAHLTHPCFVHVKYSTESQG